MNSKHFKISLLIYFLTHVLFRSLLLIIHIASFARNLSFCFNSTLDREHTGFKFIVNACILWFQICSLLVMFCMHFRKITCLDLFVCGMFYKCQLVHPFIIEWYFHCCQILLLQTCVLSLLETVCTFTKVSLPCIPRSEITRSDYMHRFNFTMYYQILLPSVFSIFPWKNSFML